VFFFFFFLKNLLTDFYESANFEFKKFLKLF